MSAYELAIEIISWILIVSGCFFLVVGAIGTFRFPDFWSRLHSVSVIDSGGMILLTAGMVVQAGPTLIAVKLIIIGVFLFITGPTATHAIANAALIQGMLPKGKKVPEVPEIGEARVGTVSQSDTTETRAKN